MLSTAGLATAAKGTRCFRMCEYKVFKINLFQNVSFSRLLADYNLFAKELGFIFSPIIFRANIDKQ